MTFHIHNQQANVINQVAGDQSITGGQHVTVTALDTARDAVAPLRQAVGAVPLDRSGAASARVWVDEIDTELRKDHPRPPVVENRLRRLTTLLESTGALAAAGATLLNPLRAVATWLGDLGENTLRLLS